MAKKNPKLVSAKRIQSEFNILKMLAALGIAVLIIVLVVFLIAEEPMDALRYFFLSPFDSVRHIGNIIENATPVLFTGVATCLLFAAGDVTLAGEGSVFLGGFLGAAVATTMPIENKLLAVIAILAAGLGGGLLSLIPVIAKKKFRCDSFVFSLLLNYVVLYVGVYILNYYMHDYSYTSGVATSMFPNGAVLDPLVKKTSVNIGCFIGVLLAFAAWFFMYRTRWGYDAQLIRANESFARYTGVSITKISLLVAFTGGFVAAMGGAVEILGKYPRYSWVSLPGYGWDGFMVATLAYYNPIFVPFAALFLGYIRTGAQILNLKTNIPLELISAIQAIMILMIASKAMMNKMQQKRIEEQTRLRAQLEYEQKEAEA